MKGLLSGLQLLSKPHVAQIWEIEATFFIPKLAPGEVWPWPNFLGLEGFLSRLRFAVDAAENVFYFGPQ